MTATITTQDQMEQAIEQLGRLYEALTALRRQVEPINPRNFAVLAEGHLEEIRRLQRELDEYAGVVAVDNGALDRIPEQRVETYVGELREIDLDKCSFVLRNAGTRPGEVLQVECVFLEELLESAKEALDKRVQVTGSRPLEESRRAKPLLVNRLEILEDRCE